MNEMLLIFPLLGILAFEPATAKGRKRDHLFLKGQDTDARGQDTAEGFVVFAGAKARGHCTPSLRSYYVDLRQDLIRQGVLETGAGGGYRLSQAYVFSSASTSASILLGRQANGRSEWKDKTGRTLRAIQEAAVAAP